MEVCWFEGGEESEIEVSLDVDDTGVVIGVEGTAAECVL